MDKRSWPWKKKSSDKTINTTNEGEFSRSDGQLTPVWNLDPIQTSANLLSPHQADEKIKHLNERLRAAEDLAKQHAIVAEEAVSGWEKAKAEYMSVKYQLDTVLEQKQATDVRVLHLDGALKECMQQLRQFREDQEQEIHEAVMKRSREWDKMRLNLEERLADADQQWMDTEKQRNLLYETVQEQAETITELGQFRSQAEAEIKKLQIQIQTLEKENTSLKYEIVILNKELDIRNQEREINSRSIEMANRQQLESTKRITKLEAECQRLRALVRKKLPGPGALLQMKLEAEVDVDKGDFFSARRSGGRSVTSPRVSLHADSERLLALEGEMDMLGEEFSMRNKGLQTTRISCAQATDKLSSLDGHVGTFPNSPRMPFVGPGFRVAERSLHKVPSQVSMSEDGNGDERSVADSWTSGFITEIALSPKEKSSSHNRNSVRSHKVLERLNSVDDFLEIERLVSLPSGNHLSSPSISMQVLATDAELQAANKLCAQVNKKLALGEEQLNVLHCKNTANELNLFKIQQKLSIILEAFERGDLEMGIDSLKKAVSALQCSTMNAHALKLSNDAIPNGSTDMSRSLESSHFQEGSHGEDRMCKIGPELTSVICKLVRTVEDLAAEGMAQHLATSGPKDCQPINAVDLGNGHRNIQYSASKPRSLELGASLRNFTAISNRYLYGKAELVQFMVELCSVLAQMKNVNSIKAHSSRMKRRPEAVQVGEQEVLSEVGSPVSLTSNSDGSESLVAKGFTVDDRLASSKRAPLNDDLRKVRAEKGKLESQLKDSQREVTHLREKLKNLEAVINHEQRRNEELQMKVQELQALLQRANSSSIEGDEEKSNKEQEIADATEKLAECQRTILVLGKQLKDIVTAQDASVVAIKSSTMLTQEDAPKDEVKRYGNSVSNFRDVQAASRISDATSGEHNLAAEGPGLEAQTSDLSSAEDDALEELEADKQLVLYVPKPASSKKMSHVFRAIHMCRSLNLEPSASPRKNGSSFGRFFSRAKNPA